VRTPKGWRIAEVESGALRAMPAPPVRFTDEAARRGLAFAPTQGSTEDPQGSQRPYVHGSGVAVADLDGDGWEDVVLVHNRGAAVFANQQGQFVAATANWGLDQPLPGILTCVLLADFDNDGRKDLFIGCERAQPVLFWNRAGRFVRAERTGITTTERTITACAADFDGDGFLDLFLGNHEDPYWIAPSMGGDADNAQPDQLFRNNGNGTFRDATAESGIHNTGWTLACTAADYDGDGDADLFVGNDFATDRLYRNDGKARFTEVTKTAGLNLPIASMSADWGDFDGDGDLDLFVGGMASNSSWMVDLPGFPAPVPWVVDFLFRSRVRHEVRAWFHGNRFYENQGDGTFRDVSLQTGTRHSGWAWSTQFCDFDNDGRLDVYSVNGFLSGPKKDDL
jgi:hypothetical protein